QGRCVGKGAEPVATHCDIGGEEARPAPSPLPDEGSRPPAAVLIGCTEIVLVAGVELLRLMLDGRDQLLAAEAPRGLGARRRPLASGAVERGVGEEVAVGAAEPASIGLERPAAAREGAPQADRADPVLRLVLG